jgi:hypothetical protein
MKKQIIANINNIANELDKVGLYTEANALTNVMKKLAQIDDIDGSVDMPKNTGIVIVQDSADTLMPEMPKFHVYAFPVGKPPVTINTYKDENGKTVKLDSLNKANQIAEDLGAEYGIEKVQKLEPKRYNPLIPEDSERD